jgi:hypothetical protein
MGLLSRLGGMMRGGAGGGAMQSRAARFVAQKEMLAASVEAESPQAAQMIRAARDELDLEDIMGRLQNPASYGQGPGVGGSTVRQQGADFGMRPPQDQWGR